MAFNPNSNSITIKKGFATPPDNFLWLKTTVSGVRQGLYKNVGEDRWEPLEASFFYPKDIEDLYAKIEEASEKIDKLDQDKQNNISISSEDHILSLEDSTLLSQLQLVYSKEDGFIYLLGRDNHILGKVPTGDFVKDGMIESVKYDEESHILTITFNQDSDNNIPIEIDLSSLMDVYTVGYGLKLEEKGKFAIDTEVVALVENLDKLSMSLNTTINSLKEDLSKKEEEINKKIEELTDSIKKNKQELTDSIANTKLELNEKIETLTESTTKSKEELTNKINEVNTSLGNQITSVESSLTSSISSLQNTVETNNTSSVARDNDLKKMIESSSAEIKESVSNIDKNYKEADQKIINNITNLTTLNWFKF